MDSANRSINLNNEAPLRSSPWHLNTPETFNILGLVLFSSLMNGICLSSVGSSTMNSKSKHFLPLCIISYLSELKSFCTVKLEPKIAFTRSRIIGIGCCIYLHITYIN